MSMLPRIGFLIISAAIIVGVHAPAHATGVAALGDSITNGYGNTAAYSWTTALDALLPETYTYTLAKGVNGATLESFVSENTNGVRFYKSSTDVFLIMLGTNNAKPENQAATTGFVDNYKAFLDVIYDSNSRNPSVFVMTPPPAFANSFGIDAAFVNENIDSMITSLAGYRGTRVVDLNDTLMSLFTTNQSTYLQDGIHPTIAGDQAIAEVIHAAMIPEPAATTWLVPVLSCVVLAGRRWTRGRRRC